MAMSSQRSWNMTMLLCSTCLWSHCRPKEQRSMNFSRNSKRLLGPRSKDTHSLRYFSIPLRVEDHFQDQMNWLPFWKPRLISQHLNLCLFIFVLSFCKDYRVGRSQWSISCRTWLWFTTESGVFWKKAACKWWQIESSSSRAAWFEATAGLWIWTISKSSVRSFVFEKTHHHVGFLENFGSPIVFVFAFYTVYLHNFIQCWLLIGRSAQDLRISSGKRQALICAAHHHVDEMSSTQRAYFQAFADLPDSGADYFSRPEKPIKPIRVLRSQVCVACSAWFAWKHFLELTVKLIFIVLCLFLQKLQEKLRSASVSAELLARLVAAVPTLSEVLKFDFLAHGLAKKSGSRQQRQPAPPSLPAKADVVLSKTSSSHSKLITDLKHAFGITDQPFRSIIPILEYIVKYMRKNLCSCKYWSFSFMNFKKWTKPSCCPLPLSLAVHSIRHHFQIIFSSSK